MIRCRTCVMPDTRPDTAWVDGECSACVSYRRRPTIDWGARKVELVKLLDRHDGRCIVPSSGGKDSTYQVLTLLGLGADVTVVTATTCHLTPMGRRNIDNLARHARTIEVTPHQTVRRKLNRLGLELVGDISWPEHCAIFTTPFRMSAALNIPLVFYGENPQDQYGGPMGSDEAQQMTRRWVSEFGGFLGLRPYDFEGMEGLTLDDLGDYTLPLGVEVEAHFLGQYIPWDSWENASVASKAGFRGSLPTRANWWWHENLDNAQTGVHDYFMFLKYGFGRGCQQVSVDVRTGRCSRDKALEFVAKNDGAFPNMYAGVLLDEVLERIEMTRDRFDEMCETFECSASA
jgi:N-acetyl sugar amidotransferase